MKKTILFAIVLITSLCGVYAGLEARPTVGDLYITGKVGIGTLDPQEAFHIENGSILFTGKSFGLSFSNKITNNAFHMSLHGNAGIVLNSLQNPTYLRVEGTANEMFLQSNAWISDTHAPQSLLLNPDGGNVGIGTRQPGARLELSDTDNVALRLSSTRGFPFNSGDVIGSIDFHSYYTGSGTGTWARIRGVADGTFSDSGQLRPTRLEFYTTSEGAGGNLQERMRITAQGNVGIGTTNPEQRLHVRGRLLLDEHDTNGWELWAGNNLHIRKKDGTDVMFLSSNGNVGIGTTHPQEKLHVNGNIKVSDGNAFILGTGKPSGTLQKGMMWIE